MSQQSLQPPQSSGGLAGSLAGNVKNLAALTAGPATTTGNPSAKSIISVLTAKSGAALRPSASTASAGLSLQIFHKPVLGGSPPIKPAASPIDGVENFLLSPAAANFPALTSNADFLLVGSAIARLPQADQPRHPPCLPSALVNFIIKTGAGGNSQPPQRVPSSSSTIGEFLLSHCFTRRRCVCHRDFLEHRQALTANHRRVKISTKGNEENKEFLTTTEQNYFPWDDQAPQIETWLECRVCKQRLSTPAALSEAQFSSSFGQFLGSFFYPDQFSDPLGSPPPSSCPHGISDYTRCFSRRGFVSSFEYENSQASEILTRRPAATADKQETLFNRFVELQTLASLTKQMIDAFHAKLDDFDPLCRNSSAALQQRLEAIRQEIRHEKSVIFALFSKLGFKGQAVDGTPMMAPARSSQISIPILGSSDSQAATLKIPDIPLCMDEDSEPLDIKRIASSQVALSFLFGGKERKSVENSSIFSENSNSGLNNFSGSSRGSDANQFSLLNSGSSTASAPGTPSPSIPVSSSSSDMLGAIIGSIHQWHSLSVDQFDINKIQSKLVSKFIEWNQQLNKIHEALKPPAVVEEEKTKTFGGLFKRKAKSQVSGDKNFLNVVGSPAENAGSSLAASAADSSALSSSVPVSKIHMNEGADFDQLSPFVTADDLLERLPTLPPACVDIFRGSQYHGHLSLPALNGGLCIPVHENEPSSIIAYTLATVEHANRLRAAALAAQSFLNDLSKKKSSDVTSPPLTPEPEVEIGVPLDDLGVEFSGDAEPSRPRARNVESARASAIFATTIPSSSGGFSGKLTPHKNYQFFNSELTSRPAIIRAMLKCGPEDAEPLLHRFEDLPSPLFFDSDQTLFKCRVFFPGQFHALRSHFSTCGGDYEFVQSLCSSLRWKATGGKSGSTFSRTRDQQFILKSVSQLEFQMFIEIAPKYFSYMEKICFDGIPSSLVKILGIYQISWRRSTGGKEKCGKTYLFVMPNLFYYSRSSIEFPIKIFDLKGSERNRYIEMKHSRPDDSRVLLDTNFLDYIDGLPISITGESYQRLKLAIYNDSMFLSALSIVDYSLLVGFYGGTGTGGSSIINSGGGGIIVGVIDYIRQYTWDKRIETGVKSVGRIAGGKMPTVIPPSDYKNRFREALEKYFIPNTGILWNNRLSGNIGGKMKSSNSYGGNSSSSSSSSSSSIIYNSLSPVSAVAHHHSISSHAIFSSLKNLNQTGNQQSGNSPTAANAEAPAAAAPATTKPPTGSGLALGGLINDDDDDDKLILPTVKFQ